MAEPNNNSQTKGQPSSAPTQDKQKKDEKKSLMQKVKSDDRLLGIASLILLILIFAIGVGTFFFVRDVVLDKDKDDNDTEEVISDSTEEETNDEETSSTTSEGETVAEDDSNTAQENTEESTTDESDTEEETTEETQEENSDTEEINEEENNPEDTTETNDEEVIAEDTTETNDNEGVAEDTEETSDEEVVAEDTEEANDEENTEEDATTSNSDSEDQEDEGTIGGDDEAVSTSKDTETQSTGHSFLGLAKATANAKEILQNGVWKATDYQKGDIVSGTYSVQLGDTLWEIADGYYGDGFAWVNILNANLDKVGTNFDGSHTLIMPGTVLVLP